MTQPDQIDDLRCVDFMRVISAYLDRELDAAEIARIERHLQGCQGCRAAVDQMAIIIHVAGQLTAENVASLDPLTRDRLMTTLRVPRRL